MINQNIYDKCESIETREISIIGVVILGIAFLMLAFFGLNFLANKIDIIFNGWIVVIGAIGYVVSKAADELSLYLIRRESEYGIRSFVDKINLFSIIISWIFLIFGIAIFLTKICKLILSVTITIFYFLF